MKLKRLFGRPDFAIPRSESVYSAIVAQARRPWLYARAGVPDTVPGRFDMVVLFATLLLERLRAGGTESELSQAILDVMFADMDRSLRELGVGDLSVAKKMRAMAEAYYGRALAYRQALADADPVAQVEKVLARNLFPGGVPPAADLYLLANHVVALHRALESIDLETALAGKFPEIPSREEARTP